MRRWHAERELMLRRWRQEIAVHEHSFVGPERGYPLQGEAPVPPVSCDEPCHCYRGMGFMRKRTAYGCGKARCGICHYEKFYVPKARANKRRAAIGYELAASS